MGYIEKACVGNVNIGLPGDGVRKDNWKHHRKCLLDMFVAILAFTSDIIGLLVSEAGSVSDMYDSDSSEARKPVLIKKPARHCLEIQGFLNI